MLRPPISATRLLLLTFAFYTFRMTPKVLTTLRVAVNLHFSDVLHFCLLPARLGLIRQARGGGSITPPYHKILKAHVASGALEIRTLTHINKLTRDDDSSQWTIDIERRCEKKALKVLKFLRPKRKGSSDEESTEEDCAACPHPDVDVQEGSLTADYIV